MTQTLREALEPGKIIEVAGHQWRVRGVHLGGIGTEDLIEIENVSHKPGWTGEWETHQMMFVPEILIRAVLASEGQSASPDLINRLEALSLTGTISWEQAMHLAGEAATALKTLTEERDDLDRRATQYALETNAAALTVASLRSRLNKARAEVEGAITQVGNVIFNSAQHQSDHQTHVRSWKYLERYLNDARSTLKGETE